ncbi:MAG: GNVR domain-containing protein [Thermodesulfobacteriota bacterium]|nr:GNVR domain-containing protein [Thermodesulfobacteriota bacterium]
MSTAIQGQPEQASFKVILGRRKWSFVFLFGIIFAIFLAVALVLPNIYQSSATVLIETQRIPPTLVPSTVTSYAEQRIQTITQQVMSRSRILRLIEKYDLLPEKRENLPTDVLVEKIRDRFSIQTIDVEANSQNLSRPLLLTIAFSLYFEDEIAKKAQAVTNEVASYYLEQNLESRQENAKGTATFLEEQLEGVKKTIQELEARIYDFRGEHLELLPDYEQLNMQKMERINNDITDINMQIRSAEEQAAAMRNRIVFLDPYGSERIYSPDERLLQLELEKAKLLSKYSSYHPSVISLDHEISLLEKNVKSVKQSQKKRERLNQLLLEQADLEANYGDEYPPLQQTNEEIKILEADLAAHSETEDYTNIDYEDATNPAYVSAKSDLIRIEIAIASQIAEKMRLEEEADFLYEKLHAMPEVAREYSELTTDYRSAKMHYDTITQKLLSAKVSQGMEDEKMGEVFEVVEPAYLPEKPAKPNRWALIIIGMFLGLGGGIGMVFIREFTDHRVHDVGMLERLVDIPILAVISVMQTTEYLAKQRRRKIIMMSSIFAGLIAGLLIFHFFVMDFYVFHAKLKRLLESRFLI